ncbi:hypothetical protein FQV39_13800 [Bosea sp. F3-2]|uniref:hypothetical protein n=1 Tax=Bosea sp. F3-2 TaxID=2599640 RepID=UPI0011EC26BE|nr:hypothetical protein [Bosea sp. F3-2]QEL23535.1 hypothetical protein FQV39_13800 [Bosea sp. F3-2]
MLKIIPSALFSLGMILAVSALGAVVPTRPWASLGNALICAGVSTSMLWNASLFGIWSDVKTPSRKSGLLFGFMALAWVIMFILDLNII